MKIELKKEVVVRKMTIIGIMIIALIVFHSILPVPDRYVADFITGVILGMYL